MWLLGGAHIGPRRGFSPRPVSSRPHPCEQASTGPSRGSSTTPGRRPSQRRRPRWWSSSKPPRPHPHQAPPSPPRRRRSRCPRRRRSQLRRCRRWRPRVLCRAASIGGAGASPPPPPPHAPCTGAGGQRWQLGRLAHFARRVHTYSPSMRTSAHGGERLFLGYVEYRYDSIRVRSCAVGVESCLLTT